MIARIIAALLFASAISGCASTPPSVAVTRWDPATASADAQRDIAAGRIRFAYIGGIASQAPGLPKDGRTWLFVLRRYEHYEIGQQGCNQDEYVFERELYARRYNQRMWSYVSKHR